MAYRQDAELDLMDGVLFGAGAYVVGFLVTLLFVELELPSDLGFYGELFGFEGYLGAQLLIHELSMLTSGEFFIEAIALAIVMAILLVAAGFVAASNAGRGRVTGDYRHGASITAGYLPLALVATVLFVLLVDGDPDMVDLGLRFLVTGLVYPVVFGAIGGAIADNA